MVSSPQPTLARFTAWVRSFMGIPATVVPDNSVWLVYAYDDAVDQVSLQLNQIGGPSYLVAVYNLAGDTLVNIAPDPDPPIPYPDVLPSDREEPDGGPGCVPTSYMAFLRYKFKINSLVPGVVQSTSDDSTSSSLVVPEQFKGLTIDDLQRAKTPWGRRYLGIAQDVGTIWGLS